MEGERSRQQTLLCAFRRSTRTGAAMLSILVMSGCTVVVSQHPLSHARTSAIDERLIGVWRCAPSGEGNTFPVAIGRHPDQPNGLEIVALTVEKGRVEVPRYTVYTKELGGRWYASMAGESDHLVALYRVGLGGIAHVYQMDVKAVGQAIDAGQLPGTGKKSFFDDIRITAEPDELAAFLLAAGDGAFETASVFDCQRFEGK